MGESPVEYNEPEKIAELAEGSRIGETGKDLHFEWKWLDALRRDMVTHELKRQIDSCWH